MKTNKKILLAIFLFINILSVSAQNISNNITNDSTKLIKKNIDIVISTEAAIYAGSMTGLYYLWYADYDRSPFHFFNDNAEWLQMDKLGHAVTAYHVGLIGYETLKLAGCDEKRSLLYGGPLGFVFLATVEVFDSFSKEWGFSWGDMIVNTLGTALFMGQQALWKKQKISLKYSFHTTQYAQYRPDVLGKNFTENMIKDYNGMTIWVSFNIKSLILNKENKFPEWLNLAIGYSGDGMTGGSKNADEYNGIPIPSYTRTREFFLAPDIDLSRIPVKNKILKMSLRVLSFIKIPMPTVMYNSQGKWEWYWLYF